MQRWIGTFVAIVTVSLVVAWPSTLSAQSSLKLGVFDPQRVSEETFEGKRIQQKLEQMRDSRQREIADEEAQIGALQQQLNQQALSLSREKLAEMEIDIQKRLLELNGRKDMMSRAFQLEIAGAEAQFNEKLRVVVAQYAKTEGFTIIFEIGAVAFASQTIDVTTGLIDQFNANFPASAE